jgi:hypothetical protein
MDGAIMSEQQFIVKWLDGNREPRNAPNPKYPNGKDIDFSRSAIPGSPACKLDLDYPAKRCGLYIVECKLCGITVAISTAGRPDDPRSVLIGCKRQ